MNIATGSIAPARNDSRKRVLLKAVLMTPEGARDVRIRDLSKSGALVACDDRLPADCDVIFRKGAIFAAARIAWSKNGEAGLNFYRELDSAELPPL